MGQIALPPELDIPQGHGKVPWIVRAIWEEHRGWFRYESTTELYDVPPTAMWAELVGAGRRHRHPDSSGPRAPRRAAAARTRCTSPTWCSPRARVRRRAEVKLGRPRAAARPRADARTSARSAGSRRDPRDCAQRSRDAAMTHPRLSVNEMCSYHWSFDQELELWQELGVRHAGLLISKIADDASKSRAPQGSGMRPSTVIIGSFALSQPETWDATRASVSAVARPRRRDGRRFHLLHARPHDGAPWRDVLSRLRRSGRARAWLTPHRGVTAGDRAVAAHRRVVREHAARRDRRRRAHRTQVDRRLRQLLDGARPARGTATRGAAHRSRTDLRRDASG